MRVVGISRVLDEADIVEAFVRHHAAFLDLHIVLDGSSVDGTVDILRALHREGLPLQVFQASSPIFAEALHNTGLYRLALEAGADWVLPLDTDELLVVRGQDSLRQMLGLVPEGVNCLRLDVFRYAPGPDPVHMLAGLQRREPLPHMSKVAVRRMALERISIYAGNHGAFVDGVFDPGLSQDRLLLAHVPYRDKLQCARKAILGRLKAIASGSAIAAAANTHEMANFEALKTEPRQWLDQDPAESACSVVEPVPYRGGPLHYTAPPDETARMLMIFAARAELLARSHGAILDRKRLIRKQLMEQARNVARIL